MFFNVLGSWIRGLLSIALLVAGILLVKEWIDELPTEVRSRDVSGAQVVRPLHSFSDRLEAWDPAHSRSTWLLVAGIVAILLTFLGRLVSPWLWRRAERGPKTTTRPKTHRLKTRNGYKIHVEHYGPVDAPVLVLVHGLGSDRTQWEEAIADLSDRFHVFAFDLLGHGKSDHDSKAVHSIEAAARDLDDVIDYTHSDRVVLAGHSMGGQIVLAWCLAHPGKLAKLAGIVLVHTTPQNPFETMAPVSLNRALKGLHETVLRVTPSLSAVVRLMNKLDYLNGMSHWSNALSMFGGSESREQLERTARLNARMDPGVVAKFALSMTRFDCRARLADMDVPSFVIAAEKDPVCIPQASHRIVRGIPQSELITLKKTRHMGFMEQREEFAEVVSRLRQPERRARAAR